MQFNEMIASLGPDTEGTIRISEDWGQGRATFGGVVGALLYQSMSAKRPEGRDLRSMAVSFVGPAIADQQTRFDARVLREGKAVSQLEARAVQGDQTVAMAIGSFGAARESTVRVEPEAAPPMPSPDDCQKLPYIEGVTPAFTRHIEMRWGLGGLPYSNRPEREMGGWMRFRHGEGEIGPAHLIALIDAWPPAVMPHLKKPAPASSLSWAFELMQPQPEVGPTDWLLYRARIDQASDGYGQTSAGIWTARGELVALSRQTVTVFG